MVENSPQNARNCTIYKNFLGGACPQTPLAKARSFAARDMPLCSMYIKNHKNFKVGPPPPEKSCIRPCLGVHKKIIGTGYWTGRVCNRIPTTIDVMHDLIVRLCDKVDNLESMVSSLQKSNVSSTVTQTMDSRSVNEGTISELIHYDLIDLSTSMQPDNTSAQGWVKYEHIFYCLLGFYALYKFTCNY